MVRLGLPNRIGAGRSPNVIRSTGDSLADRRCAHCPGSHTGERPCLASATTKVRSWLLVEHPGPWAERVEATGLPESIADALRRAGRYGVRVQFIRAPGRRRPTPPLWVYTGFS